MFSLLVTGESLTCTGSDDLSNSVPFYYHDSDSGKTVDVRMDNFAGETGTIDVTGSGLESIPCLGNSFTKSEQELMVVWAREGWSEKRRRACLLPEVRFRHVRCGDHGVW